MGYAISWLAVRGKSPEEVRRLLGLIPTGRYGEPLDSLITAALLPGGWFLVLLADPAHEFLRQGTPERISADCEVVTAAVEEHVMASLAEGWKAGRRVWSLDHQSEKGIEHLEAGGTPPESFAGIRSKAFERQRGEEAGDVDYIFDVPLQVAQSLTGFKHDEGGPDRFEILERSGRSRWGGFWNRLFGRR
jgi:hypothetical protein